MAPVRWRQIVGVVCGSSRSGALYVPVVSLIGVSILRVWDCCRKVVPVRRSGERDAIAGYLQLLRGFGRKRLRLPALWWGREASAGRELLPESEFDKANKGRRTRRYSKSERQRWAIESTKTSIGDVARRARRSERTVRQWRTEFKVSDESGPSSATAGEEERLASQRHIDDDAAGLAGFSLDELEEIGRRASDAYVEAHGEWFDDESRRQDDAKCFGRVLDAWEREHGNFTEEELARARDRRFA